MPPLVALSPVVFLAILIAYSNPIKAVGSAYDESISACDQPLITAQFDGDLFVWRDCDGGWHIRTDWRQDAGKAHVAGRVTSSLGFDLVSGYGGRSDDWFQRNGTNELVLDLNSPNARHGLDFTVPDGAELCVDIKQAASMGPTRVGYYGTPLTGAVNPETFLPCVSGSTPAIVAPANTATLGNVATWFVFDNGGQSNVEWWIDVGSSPGATDFFDSLRLTNASSVLVTGLPEDGQDVFATLFYRIEGGTEQTASYNYRAVDTTGLSITNQPPVITNSLSDLSNRELESVSFQVNATDPEGQTLHWSATGLPPNITIDANGLVSGAPGMAGRYAVTVAVADHTEGNHDAVSFNWVIEPGHQPPYTPPSAPLPSSPGLTDVSAAASAGAVIDLGHRIRTNYDFSEMFGFNLNWFAFQNQLWNSQTQSLVADNVATDMATYFSGVRQRFPGGNNAISWVWDQTRGPVSGRTDWEAFFGGMLTTPHFGVDEFVTYAKSVNAKSFFHTMNLTGLFPTDIDQIATKEDLAVSNRGLAEYFNEQWPASYPHWQLGNELERQRFGFSHQEIVDRSQASIDAVREVQPDSRFVLHLREFDYQGASWKTFMEETFDGLPQVHDYALFAYYDPTTQPGFEPPPNNIIYQMPWYLDRLHETIAHFENVVRPGETARVWITEHARRRLIVDWVDPPMDSSGEPYDPTPYLVSNLGGSISTADYLIAIMQVPQVLGAIYHGAPGGPWRLFDYELLDNDFSALTLFLTLALLHQNTLENVVATANESTNTAGYLGNYDTRAVAFHDGANKVRLWVINRNAQPLDFDITIADWANDTVTIEHAAVEGAPGQDPDDSDYEGMVDMTPDVIGTPTLSSTGVTSVSLPPSSINVYTLTR